MIFKIYVEGGGDTNKLRSECRKGFSSFFESAGLRNSTKMPSVSACGSRDDAFDAFCTAVTVARKLKKKQKQKYLPVLLVDSEASVADGEKRWEHLKQRDDWDKPNSVNEDQVFLMVECMESWFLADRECLKSYFGQGFNENSLPNETASEKITKAKVFSSLKMATRKSKKGQYGKGSHSFEILAKISAPTVEANSENCELLLERLRGEVK